MLREGDGVDARLVKQHHTATTAEHSPPLVLVGLQGSSCNNLRAPVIGKGGRSVIGTERTAADVYRVANEWEIGRDGGGVVVVLVGCSKSEDSFKARSSEKDSKKRVFRH